MTLRALTSSKNWSMPSPVPKLSDRDWSGVNLLGLVLIVMAICQLITFTDFKGWLNTIGLGGPAVWAVVLIIAEVWAGVSFMKVRLASAFRMVGLLLAVLVAGFWTVENLQLISGGAAGLLPNSGFFGRYLMQSPGWWTAIETTILLYWTIYAVDKVKNKS